MTPNTTKNVAASIRQRLLNLARERGADYNLLLTRYVHERLLYRLEQSQDADRFVVKGATLFTLWSELPYRPTRDFDLLGFGSPDLMRLENVFRSICAIPVDPDDGVRFDAESVQVHAIGEQALYDGIRIAMLASIGSARIRAQIDVGFGDAIVPTPELAVFPVLLDFPAPKLRAYMRETVIAEKLHAMVDLGMANSRLKDYFDLSYLAEHFEFDSQRLGSAIEATFKARGSTLPNDLPLGLSHTFALDTEKARQWEAFIRRTQPRSPTHSLPDTVKHIRSLIWPLIEQINRGEARLARWEPRVGWTADRE